MRIHKMFDGSYIDLDHVLAVSEVLSGHEYGEYDTDRIFTVTLAFQRYAKVFGFPDIKLEGDDLVAAFKKREAECQSILDDFIKVWGGSK